MKNTDKDGKPTPRVEKYIDKDGRPVHREYHIASDIPLPTKEQFEETHVKVLLKLTPKRDLEALEKHFKGSTNTPKAAKVEKSFTQFLINIPDDRKEIFASSLRDAFKTERGIEIRYMIEALSKAKDKIKLSLLTYGDREGASLFRSIEKYFNRDIGSRQSVFPAKSVNICEANIDKAIDRINDIFLKVTSSK